MTEAEHSILKNVEEHVINFPERDKAMKAIISEMRTEWADFKKMTMRVAATIFMLGIGYAIWVGTINRNVETVMEAIKDNDTQIHEIDRRQQITDVSNAEIKAKLSNIEATLLEIKTSLKARYP